MDTTALQSPAYVLEQDNLFLQLWPHRFDFIWAEHPEARHKPQWQTESRYPLSDRLCIQGGYLYGVRFSSITNYIMLDIDQGSLYHPTNDPLAIPRIQAALEDLGLVSSIICTSSYSGGLHLYFPFTKPQKTWEIALAIASVLESQGFKQAAGHLELFPNPRNFATQGGSTLYQAHRLPLQAGSYLLDKNYLPISSAQATFVQHWLRCQDKNDLNQVTLKHALKIARRHSYRVTTKAEKFLNDLNAEIERGWTGPGMTNRLLGRITMRSYIFGHILNADQPLSGEALVEDIVRVAKALPGFYDWSNHVHEIDKRARDWARAIEQCERYFPYGTAKTTTPVAVEESSSYHKRQASNARENVRLAVAILLNEGQLPPTVRARFQLLTSRFHVGGTTLYKHKDLWHPDYLTDEPPVENPPDPQAIKVIPEAGCYEAAPASGNPPSLLDQRSRNSPSNEGFKDARLTSMNVGSRNTLTPSEEGQLLLFKLNQAIAATKAKQQQIVAVRLGAQAEYKRQQAEAADRRHVERMKGYLASNDEILMGEALQWLQRYPERLDEIL